MSRTLTIEPAPASPAQVDDDPQFLRGPVLRAILPILGGLLVILAGVLTLNGLDIAITGPATLLAVGGYALVAALGVGLWLRKHPAPRRPAFAWRNLAGGLLSAVVLIGSVAVAVALQPSVSEEFVSLQATSGTIYSDGAVVVPASGPVSVDWQLSGFGIELAPEQSVTVTVDGTVPDDLQLIAYSNAAPEGTGFTSGMAGGVTFTAPAEPGRYTVVITVANAADPVGGQQLVVQLVVTP